MLGALTLSAFAAVNAQAQVGPMTDALCQTMRAHRVISASPAVPCVRLALVRFAYVDFAGRTHDDGQVIVLDAVADEVFAIFRELREQRFPIAGRAPDGRFRGRR